MCHSALHSDLEQALSFTLADWIQSECFHLHMSIGALQQETFPWTGFCFAQTDSQAVFVSATKNGMLSNWLVFQPSSVILNFWSSDTPYLFRVYYNLMFANYWPQMFVAMVFSACELAILFFLTHFNSSPVV